MVVLGRSNCVSFSRMSSPDRISDNAVDATVQAAMGSSSKSTLLHGFLDSARGGVSTRKTLTFHHHMRMSVSHHLAVIALPKLLLSDHNLLVERKR